MRNDNEVISKLDEWLAMNHDEIIFEDIPSLIMRNGKTVYIKDEVGFKYYVNELYSMKNIDKYYFSRKAFINLVIDNYIKFNMINDFDCNLTEEIINLENQEFHVLLPIFNVHMANTELTLGSNTFIKFQNIGEYLKGKNFCVPSNIEKIIEDTYFANTPFVDIIVQARDDNYAFEKAQVKLEEIIHLFNFIIFSNYRGIDVISSVSNNGIKERHFICGNKYCNMSFSGHSPLAWKPVLDDMVDYILNDKYCNNQLILLFENKNKNEIEKRISNAINWIGMAIAEKNNSIAFTQVIYAIESLLQYETKGEIINKSIVATLSETVAFLLGKSFEDRKNIEKKFKEIYAIRSKIAHGKSSEITIYQVLEVIDLAKKLVEELVTNSALKDASTMQKINNYITKLKYTVINEERD